MLLNDFNDWLLIIYSVAGLFFYALSLSQEVVEGEKGARARACWMITLKTPLKITLAMSSKEVCRTHDCKGSSVCVEYMQMCSVDCVHCEFCKHPKNLCTVY